MAFILLVEAANPGVPDLGTLRDVSLTSQWAPHIPLFIFALAELVVSILSAVLCCRLECGCCHDTESSRKSSAQPKGDVVDAQRLGVVSPQNSPAPSAQPVQLFIYSGAVSEMQTATSAQPVHVGSADPVSSPKSPVHPSQDPKEEKRKDHDTVGVEPTQPLGDAVVQPPANPNLQQEVVDERNESPSSVTDPAQLAISSGAVPEMQTSIDAQSTSLGLG